MPSNSPALESGETCARGCSALLAAFKAAVPDMKQLPTLLRLPGLSLRPGLPGWTWLTSRLTRGVGTLGVAPAEFGSPDPRDVQSRAAVVTTGAGGTHVPPWDAPGRAPVCAVNSASWLRNELVCALHSRPSRSSCSTLAS